MSPVLHVTARDLGEHVQEIVQGGVAVGSALEEEPRGLEEGLLADVGDELLEDGGPLGVGDAVEGLPGGLDVVDPGDDGVGSGRPGVLQVGPGLTGGGEAHPGLGVAGRLGLGPGALVIGEGLLEPGVLPPGGGHEVAEPHVTHLVEDRVGASGPLGAGDRPPEEVELLVEGDAARVLHGSEVVLRDEHAVVGVPGEAVGVDTVVEVQAGAGQVEQLGGIEVLGQAGAAGPRQRDRQAQPARGRPLPGHSVPGAGGQCGEVAGQGPGGGEGRRLTAAVRAGRGLGARSACLRAGVGHDRPAAGVRDLQREAGLDIRLLHDRPGPARVGGLEVGVEVGGAVDRVVEAVQSLTRVGVEAARRDLHRVLARVEDGQLDTGPIPDHRGWLPVDAEGVDRLPHEVHPESFGALPDVQAHQATHAEGGLVAVDGPGHVHGHVGGGHLAHGGSPGGLLVTQVRRAVGAGGRGGRHAPKSSGMRSRPRPQRAWYEDGYQASSNLSPTSPRCARAWPTGCGRRPRRRRCGGRCASRRSLAAPG